MRKGFYVSANQIIFDKDTGKQYEHSKLPFVDLILIEAATEEDAVALANKLLGDPSDCSVAIQANAEEEDFKKWENAIRTFGGEPSFAFPRNNGISLIAKWVAK